MSRVLISMLLASSVAACGAGTWRRPDSGVLSTEGVVIEAEDQSFRIVSGHQFRTPFWAYDCPGAATTGNAALGLRLGARRVRVWHPASPRPLYGVLAFCHIHPDVAGPVSRLYDIRIPDGYVTEAEGGRVSFVDEPTGHVRGYADGDQDIPAWILWLSDVPFDR